MGEVARRGRAGRGPCGEVEERNFPVSLGHGPQAVFGELVERKRNLLVAAVGVFPGFDALQALFDPGLAALVGRPVVVPV